MDRFSWNDVRSRKGKSFQQRFQSLPKLLGPFCIAIYSSHLVQGVLFWQNNFFKTVTILATLWLLLPQKIRPRWSVWSKRPRNYRKWGKRQFNFHWEAWIRSSIITFRAPNFLPFKEIPSPPSLPFRGYFHHLFINLESITPFSELPTLHKTWV